MLNTMFTWSKGLAKKPTPTHTLFFIYWNIPQIIHFWFCTKFWKHIVNFSVLFCNRSALLLWWWIQINLFSASNAERSGYRPKQKLFRFYCDHCLNTCYSDRARAHTHSKQLKQFNDSILFTNHIQSHYNAHGINAQWQLFHCHYWIRMRDLCHTSSSSVYFPQLY